MDKGHWPRCLLWHGWLPLLSGVSGAFPWAADASEIAGNLLEAALGPSLQGYSLIGECLRILMLLKLLPGCLMYLMSGLTVVWIWTRLLVFPLQIRFFFAQEPGHCWSVRRWGHVDHVRPDGGEGLSCRGFC